MGAEIQNESLTQIQSPNDKTQQNLNKILEDLKKWDISEQKKRGYYWLCY
jgi:hypothetical protein